MRLLFDENLSPKLVSVLGRAFPESMHIDALGLRGSSDTSIWDYAGAHGLTIVSKDNDFRQRAFLYGPPPQVIWLAVGNAGTAAIGRLLDASRRRIVAFSERQDEGLLILAL